MKSDTNHGNSRAEGGTSSAGVAEAQPDSLGILQLV